MFTFPWVLLFEYAVTGNEKNPLHPEWVSSLFQQQLC
jgi:hypothetical protein